jgi:predicted RNase H-like HicB family nuclease
MMREFNVVIEKDKDGFFVASVPEPRDCELSREDLQ